jgi:hypothetical protein
MYKTLKNCEYVIYKVFIEKGGAYEETVGSYILYLKQFVNSTKRFITFHYRVF